MLAKLGSDEVFEPGMGDGDPGWHGAPVYRGGGPGYPECVLLLVAGCKPATAPLPLPDAVAVVSDSGNDRVVYIHLADGALVYTLDLRALTPNDCGSDYGGTAPAGSTCIPFQSDPETITDVDGSVHDELTFTYDREAGDPYFERSAFERVRLAPPGGSDLATVLWRLDALDFQTNFAGDDDACINVNPCEDRPDDSSATLDLALRCHMAHSHDFDVVHEDQTSVDLLIADTNNERALAVHLDKSTTCGVVTSVLDDVHVPGWSIGRTPNDIDAVALDDGSTAALVTFRSSNGDVGSGGIAQGGDGNGMVMLFTPDTGGWAHAWTWPPTGFLNSPHDSSIVNSASGARFLVGAHSDGNGQNLQADWTFADDSRGSVSVAKFGADLTEPPDYRFDAVVATSRDEPGLGFVRAAVPFVAGTPGAADPAGIDWAIADSGCMSPAASCEHVPGIRTIQFDLDDPTDGDAPGDFAPHRADQTDLDAPASPPVPCGFAVPYTVTLLWSTGDAVAGTTPGTCGT